METELYIITIAILSGLLGGITTLGGFLAYANRNKQLKDSTEKLLADGVPQAALDTINKIASTLDQAFKFVISVTDGKPNTDNE